MSKYPEYPYELEFDKDANVWVSRYKVMGIVSQGRTEEEAIRSLESAIRSSVEFWERHIAFKFDVAQEESLKNIGVDLIDDHFPKGKCKERGQAIVLYALVINRILDKFGLISNKEIVICAAIKTTNGKIIRGHRHCHCIATAKAMGLDRETEVDSQGFITSKNRFVTRWEGRQLQDAAGIKSIDPSGYRSGTLFSEDIY